MGLRAYSISLIKPQIPWRLSSLVFYLILMVTPSQDENVQSLGSQDREVADASRWKFVWL
jgi:hypothetical protein